LRAKSPQSDLTAIDIFAPTIAENVPAELLSVAEKIRLEMKGLDGRLMQRRIRNQLDSQRMSYGSLHGAGMNRVPTEVLRHALEDV
jgi:hypothetical protein